jgi:hypothetical protein
MKEWTDKDIQNMINTDITRYAASHKVVNLNDLVDCDFKTVKEATFYDMVTKYLAGKRCYRLMSDNEFFLDVKCYPEDAEQVINIYDRNGFPHKVITITDTPLTDCW